MTERFIAGRQPVFDQKLGVVGYKLVLAAEHGSMLSVDWQATAAVETAGVTLDYARIFGDKAVFVGVSQTMLVGPDNFGFPPEQVVLEVPAHAVDNQAAFEGCKRLAGQGYRFAIDAGVNHEVDEPLLAMADYVKLDVGYLTWEKVTKAVSRLRSSGVKVVAKGVDSGQRSDTYKEFGFDLFEGYLLSHPLTTVSEALNPSRLACLQLIEKIQSPLSTAEDIERIVETEPGLSYRLLHVSSLGAAGGMRRKVSSVREAIVLLGRERLYDLIILMLVADVSRGAPEQLAIAMTRARMCKLLAYGMVPELADSAYTVGLISALDLILGANLYLIVENLAVDGMVTDALFKKIGPLGNILNLALGWEVAAEGLALPSGIGPAQIEKSYLDALAWSTSLCAPLEQVQPAEASAV